VPSGIRAVKQAPGLDMHPGEAVCNVTTSGKSRCERQYRRVRTLRRAEALGGFMKERMTHWVGIDLGHEKHRVCVLDQYGDVVSKRWVKHSGEAIDQLIHHLLTFAQNDPTTIAVSTETTWGAIVETLLERNFSVFSINPKQLDRFRDRYSVAGAKDDDRDSLVLADSLRTDTHVFRRLSTMPPQVIELRELLRIHQELKRESVAHGNRFGELLHRYYPQFLELGTISTDRWLWELWELVPRPELALRAYMKKIEAIIQRNKIRRVTAGQVIETLHSVPLQVAPGVVAACEQHISTILPRLRMASLQCLHCERNLDSMLAQLSKPDFGSYENTDAAILMSLPGVGVIVGATILAEASQLLAEKDLQRLRAQCGTAPVTKQSGKSSYVIRRMARNPRLQDALYHWSRVSVQVDMRSKQHYERLRADGHSYGRALRGVGDRLLSLLITMLRKRELFVPALWHRHLDSSHQEKIA